jgi:Zn-dependent protease with chaperone function
MIPPWLWIWLAGDLAVLIPAEVSDERYLFTTYTGHGALSPGLTSGTPYHLLLAFAVLAALTYAVLAVGAVSCLFPRWRGWRVEKRFGLSSDDRDVITQMQRFISEHDPDIEVRVAINGTQMARIYPVGWRAARIAVFLPLIALWTDDRAAAEAVLCHEIAHHKHGDQLVVGLGSPFTWLIRAWVPAFAVLVLVPLAVYFALGGGVLAAAVSGQGALQLAQPAELLLLPVTALWLAELNADRYTVEATGPEALLAALRAAAPADAPVHARLLALLSHPPRRLRSQLATAGNTGTVGLLAAWPAVLAIQLALLIVSALIAYLLIGKSLHMTGVSLLAGIRVFLGSNRILIIAEGVLLLCWPVLAGRWGRLWSRGPASPDGALADGPGPAPDSRLWRPYVVAALVPAVMLGASFAPLPASFPQAPAAAPLSSACARLADWDSSGGITAKSRVDADIRKMTAEASSPAATGLAEQATRLEADTARALRIPPPGAAHAAYITAMTDFRSSATALLALDARTAGIDFGNGIAADEEATALLATEGGSCTHGAVPALASPVPLAPAKSAAAAPAGQPGTARLRASLLSPADLPGGYASYTLAPLPVASDNLACMTILNGLTTTASSATASVTQVGASFAAGQAGPGLVEVLRSYTSEGGAAAAFTAVTRTLATCRRFTVRWTNPPASLIESVRPLRPLHLSSQAWSASVIIVGSPAVQETLIGVRVGRTDAFIQILLADGQPTPGQIQAIATRATAKLAA